MKNILIIIGILIVLGIIGWYLPKMPVSLSPSVSDLSNLEGDDVDLWQSYEDKEAGFSLKYPYTVTMDEKAGNLVLSIESIKIDELDYPGFDKEEVLNDVQFLKDGQPGTNYFDWSLDASEKIRDLGGLNAQEFMVLARFEVCDVVFERQLLFYNNGYRVLITLREDKDNIIDNLPQYFEKNEENCGTDAIWNFEKQEQFYQELVASKSFFTAQEWFNTFDKIVDTIEVATSN